MTTRTRFAIMLCSALMGLLVSAWATAPQPVTMIDGNQRKASKLELSVSRGSGSACQLGCNECASTGYICGCTQNLMQVWDGEDYTWVVAYCSQITWYPHMECRFSWSGTCQSLGDVLCNSETDWYASTCTGTGYANHFNDTATSICSAPNGGSGN